MKYVITNYSQYSNPDRVQLTLEDISSGNTVEVTVAACDWNLKQGQLHLDLTKKQDLRYAFNGECSKCSKPISDVETGLFYSYHKHDRKICNDCLAEALDKMLGLDRSAVTDKVLYEGDK